MQLPFSLPGPSVALVGPRPYQARAWLRHCFLGLAGYNACTYPRCFLLVHVDPKAMASESSFKE